MLQLMVTMMNTPGAGSGGSTCVSEQIAMVVGSPGGGLSTFDDDGDCPSSPGSVYVKGTDLMTAAMGDKVTAQLAAAGPVGVAAVAAIVSAKKRRRPHSFETNPSIKNYKRYCSCT